ncbi:MAG: cache domain-containing protein, partial [Bacteroidota bacterium]
MKRSRNFFLSIILPSLLTILLFVVALYAMVIPIFENAIMERKKEMILELTNTAWSILEENHQLHQKGQLTLEEAKRNARFQVEQMRYGKEQKDYFWIINTEPRMVMHPYRTELNNSMLDNYTDSHGNALFLDALKAARENGEGFIEYYWQWKDDTSRVVPKLSYVKAFPPWDWIIGTGVYLEDVEQEIKSLRTNLSRVSGLIVFIITAILIYIVRQSLLIERKRRNAELDLVKSKQRYKYLVEASTEGTLLLLNNRVTFANKKFALMYNCPDVKLTGRHFDELFSVSLEEVENRFKSTDESVTMETRFRCGERFGQDT